MPTPSSNSVYDLFVQLCKIRGVKISDIALKLEISRQGLRQRLKGMHFYSEEQLDLIDKKGYLRRIAEILDVPPSKFLVESKVSDYMGNSDEYSALPAIQQEIIRLKGENTKLRGELAAVLKNVEAIKLRLDKLESDKK